MRHPTHTEIIVDKIVVGVMLFAFVLFATGVITLFPVDGPVCTDNETPALCGSLEER